MIYKLSKNADGFCPDVRRLLSQLDDADLYYQDYHLMHPADVFTSIFDEVVESGEQLAKKYLSFISNHRTSISNEHSVESLKTDISHFLFSLSNFIAGCRSIIKSLFKKDSKESNKVLREFNKTIKNYTDYVSKMINYVKHRHRIIRSFKATWEDKMIIGYYIEGVVQKGAIGPDPDIHKDSKCAISLNRDIPFHLGNVYFVSAALKTIVSKNFEDNKEISSSEDDTKIFKLLSMVSDIPRYYFPDEIKKKWIRVYAEDKDNKSVLIELDSKKKPDNFSPHILDINLSFKVGVRNRTLVPPYFYGVGKLKC